MTDKSNSSNFRLKIVVLRSGCRSDDMFCPRCGSIKVMIEILQVVRRESVPVRQVSDTRQTDEKIDRSKPWFAGYCPPEAESKRPKEELDHPARHHTEVRRYNKSKAGVITGASVSRWRSF